MWAYLALAGVQAIGGFQQADIIRQNGTLQTNIDDMNAQFAQYDGNQALQAGYSRAAQYENVIDTTNNTIRGAEAGSNVSIGYGTAANVTANNTVAGTVNALQLQRQGQESAMGYDLQGVNMQIAGSLAGTQAEESADSTQAQGIMQALGTSVTGYTATSSSGKGQNSQSGSQISQLWSSMMKSVNMSVSPPSGGPASPDASGPSTAPTVYSNGYGWYPDSGSGGQPGFFGQGPRDDYSNALGTYSFSSETP